jgi:hypothetical protein
VINTSLYYDAVRKPLNYILDYLPISEKQEALSNTDMLINLQVQYILIWTDIWTQITHREQFLV